MKIDHLTAEILTNVVACEKPYRDIRSVLEKSNGKEKKVTLASRLCRFFLPTSVLVDLGDIHYRLNNIETLIQTYRDERTVTIIRHEKKHGPVMGDLYIGERLAFHTLERNRKHAPAGTYKAILRFSPGKGYMVYELQDVPGITELQVHIGNTLADTKACILIGSSLGWLENERAVLASAPAYTKFMAELRENERLIIKIEDQYGEAA